MKMLGAGGAEIGPVMLHICSERCIDDGFFGRFRRMVRLGRDSAICRCLVLIISIVVGDCGNQLSILFVELIASFFACFMLASMVFVEVVRNWDSVTMLNTRLPSPVWSPACCLQEKCMCLWRPSLISYPWNGVCQLKLLGVRVEIF